MSEDLRRINAWVEDEPLDMFSSLSGAGVPELLHLDDTEARASYERIRKMRAQTVVDAALVKLISIKTGAPELIASLHGNLEELRIRHREEEAKHKEEEARVLAIITASLDDVREIDRILADIPNAETGKEDCGSMEKLEEENRFLELFAIEQFDDDREELKQIFMEGGEIRIDVADLKGWLRNNRDSFQETYSVHINLAGRVSGIFTEGQLQKWVAKGTITREGGSGIIRIEDPAGFYKDALRIKNVGERIILLTKVISILQNRSI